MNKVLLSALSILLFNVAVYSQQMHVTAAAGNYTSSDAGSMSWTLNELVTDINSDPGSILTEGFQPPTISPDRVDQMAPSNLNISLLPNPAGEWVVLTIENPEGIQFCMYDISGRLIRTVKPVTTSTNINLNGLSPSVYIVKIMNARTELTTLKLIKL
jgi:hypothetical protein